MNNNVALLVIDMQEGIARGMDNIETLMEKNNQAIETARHYDKPVIFIKASFERNFLDVSLNNKFFTEIKNLGLPMTHGEKGTKILSELSPLMNEPVISRNRISSFKGGGLEVLLRSMNVNHIVLAGVATSGAILSTALEGADKDYIVTVLSDATSDPMKEKHQLIMNQILPMSCGVLTTQQWKESFDNT